MTVRDPNAAARFEALVIPNEALDQGGVEVLRAAIVDGQLYVTLRRTFEEPDHWGELLSEVARRVSRVYTAEGKLKEGEVFLRIHTSFVADGLAGTTTRPVNKPAAKRKKKPKKRARGRR